MKVQVVDVFPVKSSLDSQRGTLIDDTLILPDPYCVGEVIVRFTRFLSKEVSLVKIGEFEFDYSSSTFSDAVRNQVYSAGWFKGILGRVMEEASKMTRMET